MKGYLRKRGKKYYATVYVPGPDGKLIKKEIATGKEKKPEAQKVLNNMLHELQNNQFVMPDKMTLEKFMYKWLGVIEPNLSVTTLESYKSIISNHIIPAIGSITLQNLNSLSIQEYYTKKQEVLSAKTVHYHHRILKKALGQAVKWQLINKNPAELVDPPKPKKFTASVLEPNQVAKLLTAFKDTPIEVAVHLAVSLGLRRGEILGLRWQDIDFKNGTLQINQTLVRTTGKIHFKEPKSETSKRILNIPSHLIDLLKKHGLEQKKNKLKSGEYYQDYDLVVCNEIGEPLNPASFSKRFQEILEKYNLPKVRFHDLRHTNATLMLRSGISPKIASSRLGHSTINITMDLYTHVQNDMDKEVADKLDKLIYGK